MIFPASLSGEIFDNGSTYKSNDVSKGGSVVVPWNSKAVEKLDLDRFVRNRNQLLVQLQWLTVIL